MDLHSVTFRYPVVPATFVGDCSSLIEWPWYPCQKAIDYTCKGLFQDSQDLVLTPIPQCHDYHNFVISFEIEKYESSNFVLKIKIQISLWSALRFSLK